VKWRKGLAGLEETIAGKRLTNEKRLGADYPGVGCLEEFSQRGGFRPAEKES
jgi:hypothetical protein